jgi:hypothetical protein
MGGQVSGQTNDNQEAQVKDDTQQEPTPEPAKPEPKRRGPNKPKAPELALGRTVLYVTASSTVRPAVVTRIDSDAETVDLTVFNSQGAVPVGDVSLDAEGVAIGTYHWPERH